MTSTLVAPAPLTSASSAWRRFPSVYEINTWVWLSELSHKYGKPINLSSVPSAEWDAIAAMGFNSVWLMGVWERSPAGIAIANRNKNLLDDFRGALPDFRPEDNIGSPYCVRRYVVDEHLGGKQGLASARHELFNRGLKLILDFVPNHVAPDHPWVQEHPDYFVSGSMQDFKNDPSSYLECCGSVFACGRDPFFPAWPDVLQLNAFAPGLRKAAIETVASIAEQCDGIRCDMAMLLMNSVFERTWGARAGKRPSTEYWSDLISTVKKQYPDFLFIAEAYWDLEWELQQLGFDFCYDKKLYDRLEHEGAESVRLHLCADFEYQKRLVRFIENHDEPRAASVFNPAKECAVAVTSATLPGMKLFHEGQFEGRTVRLPVFLGRRPSEPIQGDLSTFYSQLIEMIDRDVFHEGQWTLCARSGWPDNRSFENLVAWAWTLSEERYLIVVNLGDVSAQGRIQVPWAGTSTGATHLYDLFSGNAYERNSAELLSPGLYVDLGPWQYHFFQKQ